MYSLDNSTNREKWSHIAVIFPAGHNRDLPIQVDKLFVVNVGPHAIAYAAYLYQHNGLRLIVSSNVSKELPERPPCTIEH
jgi:hypothetical protein